MNKATSWTVIYLVFAAIALLFSFMCEMEADYIFYCLIGSTIWQAADYIKNDKGDK